MKLNRAPSLQDILRFTSCRVNMQLASPLLIASSSHCDENCIVTIRHALARNITENTMTTPETTRARSIHIFHVRYPKRFLIHSTLRKFYSFLFQTISPFITIIINHCMLSVIIVIIRYDTIVPFPFRPPNRYSFV